MTWGGERDRSLVRIGDALVRIAEVVRAKRRRRATGRIVDLDPSPSGKHGATVAALAVLSEAGVIDPGTGARLLKRALAATDLAVSDLAVGDLDPCGGTRDPSGRP